MHLQFSLVQPASELLHLWHRREARAEASQEPLLSSFYHASILSHDSFARSLAFVLANRLADATLLATELFEIFHSVLREHEVLKQAALLDIVAFYERVSGWLYVQLLSPSHPSQQWVCAICVLILLQGIHTLHLCCTISCMLTRL
jgi:Serine acetyltransferase, N-terminal